MFGNHLNGKYQAMKSHNKKPSRTFIIIIITVLIIAGFFQFLKYQKRSNFIKKMNIIRTLISELENTYPDLSLGTSTHPDAFISGNVNTQADKDYIKSLLTERLGVLQTSRDIMFLKVIEDKESVTGFN